MSISRVLILVGVAVLLLAGFAYRYLSVHAMRPAAAYTKGHPSLPRQVLIATQGSAFKDRLVAGLVERLEKHPAYMKVIDIADLTAVREMDWHAIVVLHTWEYGKPPGVVVDFVARLAAPDKVVFIATSGSGRERIAGVDVISSASEIDELPTLLESVGAKVDAMLATN